MKKVSQKAQKVWWFSSGMLFGLTTLSLSMAAVPKAGRVTDDTAIYQNLSEIRAQRENDLNFDADIDRLASIEGHYKERLPKVAAKNSRVSTPMKRIEKQQYKFTGKQQKQATRPVKKTSRKRS